MSLTSYRAAPPRGTRSMSQYTGGSTRSKSPVSTIYPPHTLLPGLKPLTAVSSNRGAHPSPPAAPPQAHSYGFGFCETHRDGLISHASTDSGASSTAAPASSVPAPIVSSCGIPQSRIATRLSLPFPAKPHSARST